MNLLFIFIPLIIIFLIYYIFINKVNNKKNKKIKNKGKFKKYKSKIPNNEIKYNIYLKNINVNNIDENYLTWKFNGYNRFDKYSYILILLPYKNKQNLFQIFTENSRTLKSLYQKFTIKQNEQKIQDKKFIISEYNKNSEDCLELIPYNENIYLIKKNILFKFLHIDDKNKLYFDDGIHDNIAKFEIVS